MKKRVHGIGVLLTVFAMSAISSVAIATAQDWDSNWHQFRGPLATGEAPHAKPVVEWDTETNIRWKAKVPGVGSSTPIVWEDKIFLITSIETDRIDESLEAPEDQPERAFGIKYPNRFHTFDVVCMDRKTGDLVWQVTAKEAVPAEGVHPDNDFASATPTTDGKRLYVPFGSQGFYCYDLDGNLIWERDLGPVETRLSFGEGASLTVHEDSLIVVRDQEGQSEIYVLDAASGDTKWKAEREEPSCWATPIVVAFDGKTQVITNGHERVRSYDLETGDVIWECGGQVSNVTPSPVRFGDGVVCMSGYRGNAAMSIPLSAEGDITDSEKVNWSLGRATPYVASPVLYQGRLFFNQSLNAILSCVDAESGEVLYGPSRAEEIEKVYASPVAANGYIYFVDRDGTTAVYDAAGSEFKPVAINKLDDPIDASPAIAGDEIFLRGRDYLYCIGK